jgi:hypothetical protein
MSHVQYTVKSVNVKIFSKSGGFALRGFLRIRKKDIISFLSPVVLFSNCTLSSKNLGKLTIAKSKLSII